MAQTARVASALPSTYPKRLSVQRATTGFPSDGFVATLNPLTTAGHFPLQINWQLDAGSFHIRAITASDTWSNWSAIGLSALATDAFGGTETITSYPRGQSSMRVTAGSWPLNGYVFTTRETNSPAGSNGYQDLMDAATDAKTKRRVWAGGAWGVWRDLG